ncbi:MAG: CDGSH iron-sulfur domain-containing protein [Bacteroidetes bacterium]|nr:CDGSH iron-sulfur domain-containing protein [Bacteroidota bacterium]
MEDSSVKIEVKHNGPLTISGKCVIINTDGTETIKEGRFSLCRCGLSNKKPFCDGSHKTLTHDL